MKTKLGLLDFSHAKVKNNENDLFDVDLIIKLLLDFGNEKSNETRGKTKHAAGNGYPVDNSTAYSSPTTSTEKIVTNDHLTEEQHTITGTAPNTPGMVGQNVF